MQEGISQPLCIHYNFAVLETNISTLWQKTFWNTIILNSAERQSKREIELKCKGANVKLLRKVYLEKMRKDGFRTFQEQLSP